MREELEYEAHAWKTSTKIEIWTYRDQAAAAVSGTGAHDPATRPVRREKRQREI